MRIRCRAGSKFLGEGGFRTGPPSCRHGVVARAGVLPQLATAAHPCAARPPWRQDGVLPARRGRGFDRCRRLERSALRKKMRKNGKIPSLPEVTSSIEATTPKISEDAVSWGEGASGTWMCHDPSKDRMSSRGMGHSPRRRRTPSEARVPHCSCSCSCSCSCYCIRSLRLSPRPRPAAMAPGTRAPAPRPPPHPPHRPASTPARCRPPRHRRRPPSPRRWRHP